ncbi:MULTISPECIES: hypothetical protein [Leptolyngbya]|uniref:hypothetical protein n=1 Tax=Leptolyngbya TaxID=47251 RepID=UPI00168A2F8E|nr:hypothetical protein [Leptolyngbya sp. FACHB-1624]MBD1854483.1 hypothetical protein [Leptolyngbya sp. FACHB-1624]
MLPKFLESLGDTLAKEWVAKVFTPAFVFWFGGLLSWVLHSQSNWDTFEQWLNQKTLVQPLTTLIAGLLIVATSAIVIQQLEFSILRLLEGYWFRWLRPLRRQLIKRQKAKIDRAEKRFQILASQGIEKLTPEEADEYVQLDWQLKQTPTERDRLMPTRLGNILRAAERRPLEKYGLESVVCFPRLWLILPSEVKTELSEARARLNTMVRIWIWSVLFLVWSVWAWWAIAIAVFSALLAHRWMLDAAVIYGDLVESAFDLHRTMLYKSLRFPLPKNPTEEQRMGRALTDYLWRGFTEPEPSFENLDKAKDG